MSNVAAATPVDRFYELALLGMLSCGYLAVVGSGAVDAPTAILGGACLGLRILMALGWVRVALRPAWVSAVTLAYCGFYPLDYAFVSRDFLTATVHLVFFLAGVKALTAATNRDYLLLQVIAFLQLLAATVLPSGVAFSVFLGGFLLCAVAAFAGAEVRRSARLAQVVAPVTARQFPRRLGMVVACTCVGILFLTGVLFYLLPRTAQAALQHLVPQRYHVAGFSSRVTLGEVGDIAATGTPVMHAKLTLPPPARSRLQPLRWRGAALSRFDGWTWSNPPEPGERLYVDRGWLQLGDSRRLGVAGQPMSYDVRLHGMDSDVLFFLGTPDMVQLNSRTVRRTIDDAFSLPEGYGDGTRYFASSVVPDEDMEPLVAPGPLPSRLQARYLQMPALDSRISAMAREVTGGQPTVRGAHAMERHLQTRFGYTLRLLERPVDDPLAHFLFERKQGHCEYFASAMAVMLRTVGVPSRVVTGFAGGTFNPVSGWHVIRASDAHSWVEAYFPEKGWVTFDPTPPGRAGSAPSVWATLGFYLDAGETFWQEWVLGYDLDRQLTLAARMDRGGRPGREANWGARLADAWAQVSLVAEWMRAHAREAVAVVGLGMALGLAGPLAAAWVRSWRRSRRIRQGQPAPSDAAVLYGRMLRVLRRRGYDKPAWLTAGEFARVLPPSTMATLVEELTAAYQDVRFGNRPEAAGRMLAALERLERER